MNTSVFPFLRKYALCSNSSFPPPSTTLLLVLKLYLYLQVLLSVHLSRFSHLPLSFCISPVLFSRFLTRIKAALLQATVSSFPPAFPCRELCIRLKHLHLCQSIGLCFLIIFVVSCALLMISKEALCIWLSKQHTTALASSGIPTSPFWQDKKMTAQRITYKLHCPMQILNIVVNSSYITLNYKVSY